jgi:Natural resistance-associated macrophage protein-like
MTHSINPGPPPTPTQTPPAPTTRADAAATSRLPGRRWARLLAYPLGVLGPGLIASQAGNDAGGIATYASAGSQFGYRMLFFMLLVAIGLVLVQEMAARLGTFTGKGLAALIREEFSLRVAAFALGCLLVANLGLVVSEFGGIGAAMELFGISRYLSVPVAAAIVWGLVVLGSYRYAERLFLLMALVFFTYPIAAFLAHPNWGQVAANTLVPHLLATKAFLLLGVAIIAPPSPPTCSSTRPPPSPTKASPPSSTRWSAWTPSPARSSPARWRSSSSWPPAPPSATPARSARPPAPPEPLSRSPATTPSCCSASGCWAPAPWPPQSSPCRPPTPSRKRSGSNGRSLAPSARHPCSWACSPARSRSARRWRCCPAT